MTRKAGKLTRADWAADPDRWTGHFEGADLGTGITVLFVEIAAPGGGPKLHTHPYDEVFILREGRGRYIVGDEVIEAAAGDVVLAPAEVPHRFENVGPGRLIATDIHLSARWIQTDLEG
jgi:mannose-6-phosphate isomerase-like protein (cupin superfamily)